MKTALSQRARYDQQHSSARAPDELRQHGRIRQVVDGPGHDLLVLTDNGDGQDEILRVSPR